MPNISTTSSATTSSAFFSHSSSTTNVSSPTSLSITTSLTSSVPTTSSSPDDGHGSEMVIIISVAVAVLLIITIIIAILLIKRKMSAHTTPGSPPARTDLVPEEFIDDIQDPEQIINPRRAIKEEQNKSSTITSRKEPISQETDSCCSGSSYIEPPNYISNSNQKNKDNEREQSVYIEMGGSSHLPSPCIGTEHKRRYVNIDENQGIYANDGNTHSESGVESENECHSDNKSDKVYVNTAFDDNDYVNAPDKQKKM